MKTSFKQAVYSGGFFAGAMSILIVVAFSSVQTVADAFSLPEVILQNGFHAQLILDALTSDAMTLALPIAASLPFTASFVEDFKSGYIKQYLPRTSVRKYLTSKLLATAVSGGLVLFVGVIVSYLISAIVFLPMEMPLEEGAEAAPHLANLLSRSFLLFFSGALWSTVGLALASATASKYMAFSSPFIFYYVLIILNERYFSDLWILYPKEWINPGEQWVMGWFGVILLLLELAAIAGFGFVLAAKRRINTL